MEEFMATMTRTEQQVGFASTGIRNFLIVIGASILMALCAPIAIPLPFSPVPIAIQPHLCLFLGALLGSKRGALAMMAFIAQGAFGLPVFAKGMAGLAILFGPTGGYLLGYIVGAYVTGYLVERTKGERTMKTMFFAMAVGNIIMYVLGWMYLSRFIGMSKALMLGVLPFLIGDVLKLSLAGRALRYLKICK